MTDFEARRAELARLVEQLAGPPPLIPLGPIRGRLRTLLVRAGRPLALHQREVGRSVVRALEAIVGDAALLRNELTATHMELAAMRSGLAIARHELDGLRALLEQTSRRGDELGGNVAALLEDQQRRREELSTLRAQVADDVALYGPGRLPLEALDAGLGGEVIGYREGGGEAGDGVYLGFEEWFRGSEEVIRDRQRVYLSLLVNQRDVLDVGCGRGELLELLRDAGVTARGIDLDPAMVRRCREKGLAAEEAEAVAFLAEVPEQSIGVILAAQVVEHLSYDDLLAFLRSSHAALAPGGLLIMETVNPHNPQALKHFWIDPTHRNPLFPESLISLVRLTGFASAYIWYPQGSGDPERDRGEQADYAVVAKAGA